MKLKTRKYVFCNVKDTLHRDTGDFSVILPELETGQNIYNRLYIKKCSIPYNWKRVTSTTKQMTYIHQNGQTRNWVFTEGNPSLTDLTTEMTSLFANDLDFEFDRIQSRFIFHNHTGNQSFTIATTAYEMFGFTDANPITIQAGAYYTTPNPIDLRPPSILEVRCDVTTEGQEIRDGLLYDTNILCAIAMNVAPFSHKIWIDDQGLYFADISNENRSIRITFTSPDGTRILPQSYSYFIFGVDTFEDDEKALLNTQKESLKLQKYAMIMRKTRK